MVLSLLLFLPDASLTHIAQTSKFVHGVTTTPKFWGLKCRVVVNLNASDCRRCLYLHPSVTCFNDIVRYPHVLTLFRTFLRQNMVSENVDFVLNTQRLLGAPSVNLARTITDEFLIDTAPRQVSHSSQLKTVWTEALEKWTAQRDDEQLQHNFCLAASASMSAIVLLMDRDLVRRWLRVYSSSSQPCTLCKKTQAQT